MSERTTAGLRVLVIVVMVLILGGGTTSASSRPPKTAQATEVIHLAAQTEARVTPTAVTGAAGDLWMLGTYPCSTGTCPVLTRSNDGGKSFVKVGSPPAPVASSPPFLGLLNFANREDGYVQGKQGTPLYWTGDGGESWEPVPPRGDLYSLVTTGGHAYALWCDGGGPNCDSDYYLAVSSVAGNSWTTIALSPTTNGQIVFLAAWKSRVWLISTPAGGGLTHVLVSSDGGRSFSKSSTTGLSGYSATAIATSFQTLWGISYFGSMEGLSRSTDGGIRFVAFKEDAAGLAFLPGTRVFPVSNDEALAADSLGLGLFLTENGGQSFTRVLRRAQILEVGFATRNVWLALGNPNPTVAVPRPTNIWRTTNGGRSWQSVKAPTVTAPTTVRSADLSRFVALAHQGLREPFEAAYRFVPPLDSPTGPIPSFTVWSEPVVGSDPEGNFVYEAPFGSATFRFIKDGRGKYYECLRVASRKPWRCVGPFGSLSVGESMWVEGYRMPMFVTENLSTNLTGRLSHRTILGRRLWCLNVQPNGVLCLTKTGQLAFDAKWFVGSSQLELVSLALTESKSAFLLPAKPTRWRQAVLPNLCGKLQCPSPGML